MQVEAPGAIMSSLAASEGFAMQDAAVLTLPARKPPEPVVKAPESPPLAPPLDDPALYINRELSWLEFNRRVLDEALDARVPLLERLKFLAIVASNLDEFFMVRVGGLQQKVQAGIIVGSGADRMPPKEQLERISQVVRGLLTDAYQCLLNELLPALAKEGIVVLGLKDLTEEHRKHLREVFRREIFPVLTPLAIDPGHPFPHLLNKSLNLAVVLRRPRNQDQLFAVVQVPAVLPRFVALPAAATPAGDGALPKGQAFTTLETVIRMHLPDLFPGMEIENSIVFRVTRNSEYEIDDDEVEDLLKTIEEEIRKRRRGFAVRLEIEADAPAELNQFLMQALDLEPIDVYPTAGLIDLTGLFQIHGLAGYPNLRDPQFVPQIVPEFQSAANLWLAIRARGILVHHPFGVLSQSADVIIASAWV